MAEAKLQVLITAKDEASKQLQGVEGRLKGMSGQLRMAGVAMAAFGVAGLAMISSAKKMNAQIAVTAHGLGITEESLRSLTLEVANVTFPLQEVTATFDLLTRAGITNTAVLATTATAFDTLGDAVGMAASVVTEKMIMAMKTYGLNADEIAAKTDLVTYLVRNTTLSMDSFGSIIGYITPELVAMGLTLDDTVALMALMEERGVSGEVATRAFRTAITQATREQIPLNQALGITQKELDEYTSKLDDATGMTQEYADIANEQYGLIDKLKHGFSELTLKLGSALEPLEGIFAAMTALSPVILFLSTSVGAATIAWISHTVALVAHKIASLAAVVAIKAVIIALWAQVTATLAAVAATGYGIPIAIAAAAAIALLATGIALLVNEETKQIDIAQKSAEATVTASEAQSQYGTSVDNTTTSINKQITATRELTKTLKQAAIGAHLAYAAISAERVLTPFEFEQMQLLAKRAGIPVPGYEGGVESVPETGLAIVHKGETILSAGGERVQAPLIIALDGEPIARAVIELVGGKLRLQGA